MDGNSIDTPKSSIDLIAAGLLVILCASWGFQQVTIKVANQGISPVLQAGIRSIGGAVLIGIWMICRREPFLKKDGTLWWGLAVGVIFAAEFMLIYWGLVFTTASRAVIFLYTMPFWTALGAQLFLPGERLVRMQVAGLCCAFVGILVVFGESLVLPTRRILIGDGMLLSAALLWAAATILIKAGPLCRIQPAKTLLYQIGISALLLPLGSAAMGEPGVFRLDPLILACLLYQVVWVAFITYLTWFWLILRYPAPRLAGFLFMTPLFGVVSGAVFLHEPLTGGLLTALVLVAVGIYLVNRPAAVQKIPGPCRNE